MVQVKTRFFLFLCLAGGAGAQVELRIQAPKTRFYLGEMIPLTLSFKAASAGPFVAETRLYDRVGRMNGIEEFIVEPTGAAQDPLHGLPGESGGLGGISGGDAKLLGSSRSAGYRAPHRISSRPAVRSVSARSSIARSPVASIAVMLRNRRITIGGNAEISSVTFAILSVTPNRNGP